jgi:hypothetical protein
MPSGSGTNSRTQNSRKPRERHPIPRIHSLKFAYSLRYDKQQIIERVEASIAPPTTSNRVRVSKKPNIEVNILVPKQFISLLSPKSNHINTHFSKNPIFSTAGPG